VRPPGSILLREGFCLLCLPPSPPFQLRCARACICVCERSAVSSLAEECVRLCVFVCVSTHARQLLTHLHTCLYTHTHISVRALSHTHIPALSHTHKHTYTCTHTHTNAHIHMHKHTYTTARTHARLHTHMGNVSVRAHQKVVHTTHSLTHTHTHTGKREQHTTSGIAAPMAS